MDALLSDERQKTVRYSPFSHLHLKTTYIFFLVKVKMYFDELKL